MPETWLDRWPERVEFELRSLDEAGIPYERDEEAWGRGVLRLALKPVVGGQALELWAEFPDAYPYFRFEVYAPALILEHHQNPFEKNLCLLGRASEDWRVSDTLAGVLTEQLPKLLQAAQSNDQNLYGALEEHQGEPFTAYYEYAQRSIIIIDSEWSPTGDRGELLIGLEPSPVALGHERAIRGAVLELRDSAGRMLFNTTQGLRHAYPLAVESRWQRIDAPPRTKDASGFRVNLHHARWRNAGAGMDVDITGFVFPEEVSWRSFKDGWAFAVRTRSKRGPTSIERLDLVRAGRAGRSDLAARVPELSQLACKTVAVAGLGCIGAPSALQFARAGIGTLRLLDDDIVEPGTIVRWPLGLRAAGRQKVEALFSFIAENYPHTVVSGHPYRFGAIRGAGRLESEVIEEWLSGTDLIYDATTDPAVQNMLSGHARQKSLPYVAISATNGGWGGRVLRIKPDTLGCWSCLQFWLTEGSVPVPVADPTEFLQPAGCASPTFAGASFDVEEVSLMGVRVAVSTLTEKYPTVAWDVAVLNLRDEGGAFLGPQWTTYRLEKHPGCPLH